MLRAIPRGLFSWGFSIFKDDIEVARLDVAWMREKGTSKAPVKTGKE